MAKTIKASELKANCLALLDEVVRTGKKIVITKNGKPVAELGPLQVTKRNARGILKGKLLIKGDIVSPLGVDWDALKRSS